MAAKLVEIQKSRKAFVCETCKSKGKTPKECVIPVGSHYKWLTTTKEPCFHWDCEIDPKFFAEPSRDEAIEDNSALAMGVDRKEVIKTRIAKLQAELEKLETKIEEAPEEEKAPEAFDDPELNKAFAKFDTVEA